MNIKCSYLKTINLNFKKIYFKKKTRVVNLSLIGYFICLDIDSKHSFTTDYTHILTQAQQTHTQHTHKPTPSYTPRIPKL